MKIDIGRRIEHTPLPHHKALMSLFEAISNSLHSLVDKRESAGRVDVLIERHPSDLLGAGPVSTIHIVDNGVGFTDANYDAFNEADTDHKKIRGGKGVGRFLWLKVFERVHVESTYFEGTWKRRVFDFTVSKEGIENHSIKEVPGGAGREETRVSLSGVRGPFAKHVPRSVAIIAGRIAEHFLPLLFDPGQPTILVRDDQETVSVNQTFAETFGARAVSVDFRVGPDTFTLRHVFNTGGYETPGHRVHYCADFRSVQSDTLARLLPSVPRTKLMLDGTLFYYVGLLSGAALDQGANAQRTAIDLPDYADDLPVGLQGELLTWSALRTAVSEQVREFLHPAMTTVLSERLRRIEKLAQKEPQYHYLLRNHRDEIERISADATDEASLDAELRKIEFSAIQRVRDRGKRLAEVRIQTAEELTKYRNEYARFVAEENAVGQAALARYVVHRRAILDVVGGFLGINDRGSFAFEEVIHDIICPMRSTSRDPEFSAHNLWLVNDQLEYHSYLASDKYIDNMEDIEAPDHVRPDILVYDRNYVFGDEAPYTSMVVVEFKRPRRDDYTLTENPIAEIVDYVHRLRKGKVKDERHRFIDFNPDSPCFGYAVCDITPTLRSVAEVEDWERSADGEGFRFYKKGLRLHVEVISYDKMLKDARKRNRVLFDKLGLPTR